MKCIIINDSNYQEHLDKITLIYGLTEAEIVALSQSAADVVPEAPYIAKLIGEKAVSLCESALGRELSAVLIWLWTGKAVAAMLKYLPVHAFTMIEAGMPLLAIAWAGNELVLERVIIHECCHAARIIHLGLKTHPEYVHYLEDPLAWIYEEMLAMAMEKYTHPELSWEEVAGIQYNPIWITWTESGRFPNHFLPSQLRTVFMDQLEVLQVDPAVLVYYLAYRICRTAPVLKNLRRMPTLSFEEGFKLL